MARWETGLDPKPRLCMLDGMSHRIPSPKLVSAWHVSPYALRQATIRQAYLIQLARYRGFRALGYSVLVSYRLSLRNP